MMTEQEAAKKWCPFARVATPVTAYPTGHVITAIASNRASKTAKDAKLEAEVCPESARCIGSRCMAWRWGTRDRDGYIRIGDTGTVMPSHSRERLTVGYCGLAGTQP